MKNFIKKLTVNRVLAILFMMFTLHTGFAAVPALLSGINDTVKAQKHNMTTYRDAIDKIYKDGMLSTKLEQPLWKNKASYINLNGLMARIMGQRYVNEIVLMDNGHLATYRESHVDIQPAIAQMTKLYQKQTEKGKGFLFVMTPMQISKYDPQMPVGYQKETYNADADLFIRKLTENHVPVLDLREKMYEQGIEYKDAFFKTDHHWRPQTGFWAYGEIIKRLEEMRLIPKVDPFYTNPDSYEFRLYKDLFLGSSGRRTGQYYAGVDDFHLIVPKFETNISLKIPARKVDCSGRFEDTIYNKRLYEKVDFFNLSPYAAYEYGDNAFSCWRNERAPIKKRAIFMGDSFGNISFPLLSLCISDCDEFDMRHYKGDFAEHYNSFDPDFIIVLVNPYNVVGSNTVYDFFPENKE